MPQFKSSDTVKPSLDVTGTDAEALDVTGGAEFGSGNVELIGVDGKINGPLSSTIIDDLSGANLTTLAAGALSSGTVATARLGSGTASSGTFLRGDSSWTAVSATSAAGSDTQVQYNDGGTNFGGDAGLVYNDSTDVLTSGKLATTDTSATSIDVAGGITAGTSNIAIVNAVGKIPELSSTYLADLSGANLTGLSSAVNVYATTIADVSNTTSQTAIVTGAEIAADAWTDGGLLEIFMTFICNNQSGGNKTVGLAVGVDDGSYKAHDSDHTWEAPAAVKYQSFCITMLRAGTDIYIGNGSTNQGPYSGQFGNPGNGNAPRLTGIDFTTGIDPIIKITFPSALTTLYIDMKSALIRLTPAGA